MRLRKEVSSREAEPPGRPSGINGGSRVKGGVGGQQQAGGAGVCNVACVNPYGCNVVRTLLVGSTVSPL